MIYSKMRLAITNKEIRERRKLSYRTIAKETGLSTVTLVRYGTFEPLGKINCQTLSTLCKYFQCGIADLIEYREEETA